MIDKAFLGALAIFVLLGCSNSSATPLESIPIRSMTAADMFPDDELAQALVRAVSKGDIRKIDALVAQGADVNAQGTRGHTPLVWALTHPNKKGFKRLLELGADPNLQQPGSDFSPLYWAVMRSSPMTSNLDLDYLRMMFEIGKADPNLRGLEWGTMPVEWALSTSEEPVFSVFVEHGLNIDQTGGYDNSLVSAAANIGNYKVVYWMLEKGVNYTHVPNHPRGGLRRTLQDIINSSFGYHFAKDPSSDNYMWLWRVVDWLEQRGMTFKIPPDVKRPEKLDTIPAVLDSESPPKVHLSRTVFIHEAQLKYPTPFWTHTEETADDVKTRFGQKSGMIFYLSIPRDESTESWTRLHEIIGIYDPGASFEDFSRAAPQYVEKVISKTPALQVVEKLDDAIIYHFEQKESHVEGAAWLGKCKNTFLLVIQAWKNVEGEEPDRVKRVIDQMKRITSEPVFDVKPMTKEMEKELN